MPKIIDPDSLIRGTEIVFNTTAKTIQLVVAGNLSTDGVTLQAVYSFCKEEWKDQADLIKLPFPMEAITEVKFDVINGWDFADTLTRQLIRDGGWAVRDAGGVSTDEYFGFITLGLMDNPAVDRAYYQQVAGNTAATTATVYPGPVNESVRIWDNVTSYRTFFNAFLREQGKVYSQSSLAEQAVNNIDYTVYKLPLANATDPKIVATDIQIEDTGVLQGVYAGMQISYLRGTGFTTWVSSGSYVVDQVVQSPSTFRWFRALTNHSGVVTDPSADATNWVAYLGERQIGASWYPFRVIVNANGQVAENVYEFTQYMNRQAVNINDDAFTDTFGAVNGNIASQLLSFLGDTLVTGVGVYIDSFNSNDTNRIEFRDATSTTQTFPFVAAGTINFNDNLQNDASAKYWMFFNTLPQSVTPGDQDYGTVGAIIVNDNAGSPITGLISAAPSVSFTFDYDGNVQGGRTAGTDAGIVIVAIGLTTAQFVRVNGSITRNVGINFSLVSALERNYSNPA